MQYYGHLGTALGSVSAIDWLGMYEKGLVGCSLTPSAEVKAKQHSQLTEQITFELYKEALSEYLVKMETSHKFSEAQQKEMKDKLNHLFLCLSPNDRVKVPQIESKGQSAGTDGKDEIVAVDVHSESLVPEAKKVHEMFDKKL